MTPHANKALPPFRSRCFRDIYPIQRCFCGLIAQGAFRLLSAYVDEMSFGFNNRDKPYLFRHSLLELLESDGLPYRELITSTP